MKEAIKVTKKNKELSARTNNIWKKHDFAMTRKGEWLNHFFRCIKWSRQRITRGYADPDVWEMYGYLQMLIPDMLQYLKDNRYGSPAYLGENYVNEDGILDNNTCHAEWDKILDKMIFLWHESDEEMCSKKNPYEEEHLRAFIEFEEKYGLLGEGLMTEEEKGEQARSGNRTLHFMNETSEYKDLDEKYMEESKKLDKYRSDCKDEAIDMLKEYFYCLWD